MLTQETKQKINTARDILVGKIPDPKAQVEQITTALIYKFMDDMDKESEEVGGKRSFFTGDYEQYSWTKLLDSSLGNQDRMNLYNEATAKMPQNPKLPQLFRNIFKGYFLPYRDPETLSLFLKKINEFKYDHSEELGNAFEYLLSIMSSQGDAGQFRTPRHIIDFIVSVVDPKKDESILDPACGTAGFLISAYKHILEQNKDKQLNPDEKERLMKNIVGYDISPDMVKLSLVNLYLHGFPDPKILEYDTLTSEEKWNDSFDTILANPPFMTPKGGIQPHNRFIVKAKKSEILFVDYIIEHLEASGKAGIIVPIGVAFQDMSAYESLRKILIENDLLWAVVTLPEGIFNPYSDAETKILFIDKKLARLTKNILFVELKNDGFSLGNTREPIDKNDIPEATNILLKYKNDLVKGIIPDEFSKKLSVDLIPVDKIKKNKYLLIQERYVTDKLAGVNSIPLSRVLIRNKTPINIIDGITYKRATIRLYGKGIEVRDELDGKKIITKRQFLIKSGQLLLSKIDARNGAFGIVPDSLDKAIITGNFWAFDIDKKVVDEKYLSYLLSSKEFYSICKGASSGVTNRKYLDEQKFLSMRIDIPNLDSQKKIIKEIVEYENEIAIFQKKIKKITTEVWGE